MRRYIIPLVVAFAIVVPLALTGFVRSTPAEAAPRANIVPGKYIVTLKPGEKPHGVTNRFVRQADIEVEHVYEHVFPGFSAVIPDHQLDKVRNDPAVLSVIEDRIITTSEDTSPTGIRRTEADRNAISQIGSDTNPINIDVAIIDSGIDGDHPDLNVVGGVNCVPGETSWEDQNGHGTHVAGTVAALDNGSGVVGVAPGARLWAVRVLNANGEGEFSDAICGIDWVTANADIIEIANMSLGGEGTVTGCSNGGFHQAVCASVAAGITYVVASGNSGVNASGFVPAAFPEVITVSAIVDTDGQPGGNGPTSFFYGDDDTLATFSNFGSVVDIAAPGVNIQSTWVGGTYAPSSGTSMASPHVAGAAAIYAYQNPGASPAAIRAHILGEAWAQGAPEGFTGDPDSFAEPLLNVGTIGGLEPLPPPPPPEPGCSLAPESGIVGSTTSLTCTGFLGGEWVWIYWDSVSSNPKGIFIAGGAGDGTATVTIPESALGEHTVIAAGATSGIQANLPFTVEPSIRMLWSNGKVGTSLLVYVKGYAANESVELRWHFDPQNYTVLGSVTTNANGQGTLFGKVPSAAGGTYTIEAVGADSGGTSGGEFTVDPGMTISPSIGRVGTNATTTVTGFQAGEEVDFQWNGVTVASGVADASGEAEMPFVVPDAPAGANPVAAIGSAVSQVSGSYNVLSSATLSATSGIVGQNVDVTVAGFAAGEDVRIDWYDTTSTFTTILTLQTTAEGGAAESFAVPEAVSGYHPVKAVGVSSGKVVTASFTIKTHIEVSPTSGFPGDTVTATLTGNKANDSINIKWYEVPYIGEVIGSTTTSPLGSGAFVFQVPANASPGDHKVESIATSGLGRASTNFTVENDGGPVVATCEPVDDSGYVQTSVTVDCFGFEPGDFVRLYLDSTSSSQVGAGYASNGSAIVTMNVPNAAGGEHTLIGVGSNSGAESNATFTVLSSLKFSNSSGAVGSLAFATLRGFGAGETVDFIWHDSGSSFIVHSVTTSNVGYATGYFSVPEMSGGVYTVEAQGQSTGLSASTDFTIQSSVKLVPTIGKVGSNLSVTFSGFDAGSNVDITWDGAVMGTVTASSTGSGSLATTVPEATEGSHTVTADDGNGASASAIYKITPAMTLSSTSGPVGSEITLDISGFRAGEDVRIEWWDTSGSYTEVTTITASADGSGTYQLTVPDATYSLHKVQAVGLQSQKKAYVNFIVQAAVALSDDQGPAGTSVTVTLSGYQANKDVSVRWYTNSYSYYEIATGTTDAFGSATVTFDVPDDATPGDHKIDVRNTVGYPSANDIFTVT